MTSPVHDALTKAAACRSKVPVLPGEMPDEMWTVLSTDRDVATEALRLLVRQTLDEYEEAILALRDSLGAQQNAAGQVSVGETHGARDGISPEVSPPAPAAPQPASEAALLPGLKEALLWKPNTPQLENAMTYAWESALKSFIRSIEEHIRTVDRSKA